MIVALQLVIVLEHQTKQLVLGGLGGVVAALLGGWDVVRRDVL